MELTNQAEWYAYCKSGNKPKDIPTNPNIKYKNEGWIGYGDWLGTDNVAPTRKHFLTFKKARYFVHLLNLKSQMQWNEYCTSGKRPDDIPTNPQRTYKGKGWISWPDWLGTDKSKK